MSYPFVMLNARILLGSGSLALALCTIGCGHPIEKQLEGRWHGEGVENVDHAIVAVATGWAKGTTMEFAGSTVTITIPAEDPRSAEYEVVSVEGSEVNLAIKSKSSTDKARLYIDDEASMRWDIGGGRAVLMKREL